LEQRRSHLGLVGVELPGVEVHHERIRALPHPARDLAPDKRFGELAEVVPARYRDTLPQHGRGAHRKLVDASEGCRMRVHYFPPRLICELAEEWRQAGVILVAFGRQDVERPQIRLSVPEARGAMAEDGTTGCLLDGFA